jgi:predicted RNA binding protein YcfA (HicA-like mRNA interferase family)
VVKLPVVSGSELVALLKKAGFKTIRRKGSHVSLQKENFRTIIPLHDELAKGTLIAILKQCGMSKEDLARLL